MKILFRIVICLTIILLCQSINAQTLLDGKKWTRTDIGTNKPSGGFMTGSMQGAAVYNGNMYQFRTNGASGVNYDVYNISAGTWTSGTALTCIPSSHAGSANFGTKVFTTSDGYTYNCTIPFLYLTNGQTIQIVDIEHNVLVATWTLASALQDDAIAAFDFAGGTLYSIGYVSGSRKAPYIFRTRTGLDFNAVPTDQTITFTDAEKTSLGGPDAQGIQHDLQNGTIQDCQYVDGKIYIATGGGSSAHRTEFCRVHVYDTSSKTIVDTKMCADDNEAEGFVYDATTETFVMTTLNKYVWKLSTGSGYDSYNFQPATKNGEYYEISTPSQLLWFKQQVYGGRSDIKAKLIADINMNGVTDPFSYYVYDYNIALAGKTTPTYPAYFAFRGEFDGNGHTISNYTISSTPYYYDGLFPYCIGANIHDLTVTGSITLSQCSAMVQSGSSWNATSNQPVANVGLIGYMDGGTVTNVNVIGLTINETVAGESGTINKLVGGEGSTAVTKTNNLLTDPSSTAHDGSGTDHVYINGFCSLQGASASTDGYYETPSGSGTSADPYLINNAGKLWWFAKYVNGLSTGNQAIHAKLTADINMEESTRGSFPGIGRYQGAVYAGTFDGQGHTISNFYISQGTDRCGLFSYTDGATIKNFNLSGEIGISSGIKHGSVVGWAINTTMEKIYSSVNITSAAAQQIGGIVGCLQKGTAKQCRYSGAITSASAYNKIAGLSGSMVGGKLVDCLFDGTLKLSVSNSGLIAGGLVACTMDAANNAITNCLMNGTINITNPTARCGAIVGLISKFSFTGTNIYYNSTKTTLGSTANTPDIENNNGTAPTWSMSATAVDPTAASFNWGTIKNNLNAGSTNWGINGDKAAYPLPNEVDKDATPVTKYTIIFKDYDGREIQNTQVTEGANITKPTDPTRTGYKFDGWTTDGTNIVTWPQTATTDMTFTAKYTESTTNYVNGFNTNGTSTDADYYEEATLDTDGYYIINNAGKLFWFANQVNAGNATYNAKVTADIDMDGTNHPNFPGIGYYHSNDKTYQKPFSGNFDGQGHRIYNCDITTNNSSYWGSGLIGYAYATSSPKKEIKDFTLEGKVTAKCAARAGGVLGYVADGYSISGITSSVTIESTTLKTGGLAGFISTSTVSKCRFNGTISNSNNWTGGLFAEVLKGCTISDCLFDGTVNATRDNADVATGGIAGIIGGQTSNTVSNCLSYGTITTKKTGTNTGKVFGRVDGALTLSNVYYGAQETSTPTIDYNENGKTITGSVTTITTETWQEIKNDLNNGRTPTVWGIGSQVYPVPGEADQTQYTVTFNSKGGSNCDAVTKVANSVITLPTPTKSGYLFTGWTVAEDGTGTKYEGGASYTITADVTLYAQWELAYTITFVTNGGSACEAVTKAAGTEITLPTPTKSGYVFNGWNTAEGGTGTSYAGGASYIITANATLYAQWTEDETGDYRNGFHKTHDKSADDYYQAPELITAERCTTLGIDASYTTNGYYEVKNAGNMFWIAKNLSADNNTRKYVMTDNINMAGDDANHKDWAGISAWGSTDTHFKGTFDGLGHKFTNYYMSVTGSNSWKGMFSVPNGATIKNFTVSGNIDISSTGTQFGTICGRVAGTTTLEDIHSAVNITVAAGKTPASVGGLVGQCSAQTSFNRCRYSGIITGNSAYKNLGGIFGNAEAVVNVNNCLFDGAISSTSTKTQGTNADDAIQIGGVAGRNNNKTTITNSLVNGTISVAAGSEALDAEKTHTGIIFGYQYTTADLTITNTYYSTSKCTSGLRAVGLNSATNQSKAAPTEKTTQTWEEIKVSLNGSSVPVNWGINSQIYPVPGEIDATPVTKYTITFNDWNGTQIQQTQVKEGDVITAPADPTRTGYNFTGWNPAFTAGTTATEEKTYTAQYSINQYTITFNMNGATSAAIASITQDYGTAITAPANPTKDGYTFAGWVDEDGQTTTVPATMPEKSITLKATWTINQYTITFNMNGATSATIASITQDYGTAITAPTNPTKDGYTFDGWNPAVPSTMPGQNTTCVAQWTINQYTIHFDLNGGTSAAIADITQDYGTSITAPADPTRTDWDFKGWSPAVPSTMPAENITCVAQWSQDSYTNGFNDDWSTCAADKKYEEPVLITTARCAELGIDESYATNCYYEVKNAGNMFWISKNFSASNNNRKYVVTADIDMEGNKTIHQDWKGISTYIADGSTHFTGAFDGLGHKFTNYYRAISSGNINGMFNCVQGATIKNFSVEGNVYINDNVTQTGVIIGRVAGGDKTQTTLEDIHSNVAIEVAVGKTPSSIGGLIGQVSGKTSMNRCRYNGTITGNSAYAGIGGIIGNGENPISLDNCLFDGTISTSSTQTRTGVDDGIKIGGLCGRNNNTTKITNSMSIGTISVPEAADKGNVGIIFGTQTNTSKFTITNTHYSTSSCTSGIGAVGNNSNTDKTSAAPTELPASPDWAAIRKTLGISNWVIDQTKYGKEYPIPAIFKCTHTYDQYGFCTICGEPEPIGDPVLDSKDSKYYYHIDHFADLEQFAAKVNSATKGTEINAKLSANIDLTGLGRSVTTMIGDKDHPYCGTFDGQGYTMKGFNIEGGSDQRYVGVFACVGIKDKDENKVKAGIVKNFSINGTITSSYFTQWWTNTPLVMGVIGEIYAGTVENVHSMVNFNCTSGTRSHIGGVVGGSLHNTDDAGNIVIKNCSYEGTMTLNACDAIGGIVGYAQHKTSIYNTLFSGTINQSYTRPDGEDDTAHDKNEGTVSTYIGGVLGYCNSSTDGVQNCVLAGTMTTNLDIASDGEMKKPGNNLNAVVGFDGQINSSYTNYTGNYVTDKYSTDYHQYPATKFAGTSKIRTYAEFATGQVCAELNADATATDNPWGQILGYQVGANKDPNSPAQAYPYPGYTDSEQTTYRVVRSQNAQDNTKYDYTADYYFFDDMGDTTPFPTDAASMKIRKVEYTRAGSYLKGYISMCLPWAFTEAMKPSNDTKFYAYSSTVGTTVNFTEIAEFPIAAGTPFIMYDTSGADWKPFVDAEGKVPMFDAENAIPVALAAGSQTKTDGGTEGCGIYGTFNTMKTGEWALNNQLFKINPEGTALVKTRPFSDCFAYRVYLKLPSASTSKNYAIQWGNATSIDLISTPQNDVNTPIYNLQGHKVNNATKGIVIKNGKKYYIK